MLPGPLQFPLSQPLPHRQSALRARLFGDKGTARPSKRPRPADDDDDGAGSSNEQENATKQQSNSAYIRCRSLKVRCESNDVTCKHCAQANMEWVIPDRKPRRPPNREVLLKQIREQASQIVELMAKLKRSNQSAGPSQAVTGPLESQSPPATAIDSNAMDIFPK
ncbi:hypothetical protein BKA82DRAFT_997646 [Pisolithus tinctorius]|uniref:Zn(2)-C6 fungal-type domain-containing protein n=1 Tax=Pisolithus tinctorius Marx 270 TaxID=870435 RepID=A0A0C3JFU1_PISTI|nr:hypothetical protein BKA82DRAFT_997646 [Pisolithus tinctorius]KIO07948.1 hypothetical protein M404DRAFT_997646 [Pisolithus tinctorius Marx 270]